MVGFRSFALVCLQLGALLSPLAGAAPTNDNERRSLPPPSQDPFYTAPSGFESKAPGTILKTRPVITAIFGFIPNPVLSWQLLYRTTAIDGSAIVGVTTVFKPLLGAKTDRFVSFHTAYDSSATKCNPSYNYRLGANQTDLIVSVETLALELYLLSGYIVSSPDYEGPEAAFGAGRLSGTGVLDSMRAVANFKSTLGLSTSTPMVVGVGYSGGAIATGWAAALQPSYAPELRIKGWAAGGTPANLTSTLLYLDGGLFSGFIPPAVVGLGRPSAYGATISTLINSLATAKGKASLAAAGENCAVDDLLNFAGQSILDYSYQSLGPNLLSDSRVKSVLQKNILGINRAETPKAPVYLYHAVPDEIIPYSGSAALNRAWCGYGASVNFVTYGAGGHITTEIAAIPSVLTFVKAAFAGTVASGCSASTVANPSINPLAYALDLEPILLALIARLVIAGNNDANIKNDLGTLKRGYSSSSSPSSDSPVSTLEDIAGAFWPFGKLPFKRD